MKGAKGDIWIQGAGEMASGVAVRLVRSGYRVVMAEIEKPMAVRRRVCFSESVYSGSAVVEDVPGRLVEPGEAEFHPDQVQVILDPAARQLAALAPAAVIDARMTKLPPVPLAGCRCVVIGLGPGFVCGESADLIIETHREARLGAVISEGCAVANTGIPGPVGGESARRIVRAPCDGRMRQQVRIGDLVTEGQQLGDIDGQPVSSPLTGMVRGLIHPEAELTAGVKVGDIDPRGSDIDPKLVSDKALAVAGGVLEALLRSKIRPTA